MAVSPVPDDAPVDADADFVRDSYLAYVVPLATDCRLEQALEQCASRGELPQAVIEAIEDRESLFFDETVDVYLILRTPYQSESRLRSYLDRLAVAVEAQIVNSHVPGRESSPPVVEVIFSGVVEDAHKPLAVVSDPETNSKESSDEEDDSEDSEESTEDGSKTKQSATRQTYILWRLPVFLGRPRARLHGPSVSFSAVASLKPAAASNTSTLPYRAATDGEDHPAAAAENGFGYLRSREPSGLNLLEPFAGDPALAGASPRLSAQRVSRVAPAAAFRESQNARWQKPRPLRGLKQVAFRIVPAVHTRVRFARPNAGPSSSPAVVALLEVDFTPFFECEVVLSRIDLSLPSGVVADLNASAEGLSLPLYCVARDHFTFLYRLSPLEYDVNRPHHNSHVGHNKPGELNPSRELAVTIEATALVKPGVCTPKLKMAWTTSLDFSLPVFNPGFGTTALLPPQSLQRAHRPSQLSIDGMSSFASPAVSRPDALPSLEAAAARSTETTIPDFGITMTFTAPSHAVYAGEEFSWNVFVVNRAAASQPPMATSPLTGGGGNAAQQQPPPARKLALIALPKRRRNDVRVLRPPSTAGRHGGHHAGGRGRAGTLTGGNSGTATTEDPVEAVADAVLDENIVHAMQRSSLVDSTDVVCLSSADSCRVGPLAPNACHVVELRFLALKPGALAVEAVRVVDLGSQEHVDVRELPAMLVAEGRRGDVAGKR